MTAPAVRTVLGVAAFGCLVLTGCGREYGGAGPEAAAASESAGEKASLSMRDLRRGFYVSDIATSCADASNASLRLLRRNASSTSHVVCKFDRIEADKDGRFVVAQTCTDDSAAFGGATNVIAMTETFQLTSETEFQVIWPDADPMTYRYCAQADLPEPWRNNDISALID